MSSRRGLVSIVIAILIALVYWPGLYGFWTRDDFMQLAFARLVGSPWPIFAHDHYFPGPGSIFRPLGFASFWLWQALFGTDYFAHAFADMLLHIGVSLALYGVIRAGKVERAPAALCTLLFALHPAVLGTALWWSARFDLLATLFGFVAVRAALDYTERARTASLPIALAAALAALLSKEIALAAVAAIALVWLRLAWVDRERRAELLRAVAWLALVVVFFFVWRWRVLGTAASGLAGDMPLSGLIGKGIVDWIAFVGGYLTFRARMDVPDATALVIVAAAAVIASVAAYAMRTLGPQDSSRANLVIPGVCLFVLPALLQAPIAALNARPLSGDTFAVEAAMQSRLYYLGIGGLVMASAVPIRRVMSGGGIARIVLAASLIVAVGIFGWVSHEAAAAFAKRTVVPKAMADAAVAAVDRLAESRAPCHIVLLGIERPPEWSLFVSMDSVAKALSTDLNRIGRCFVHADYPTYFHVMSGAAAPADAAPYTPRAANGRPFDWLRVGDALVAYLDPPRTVDRTALAGIVFLRYENGAFRDVTADVADGRLAVTLQ